MPRIHHVSLEVEPGLVEDEARFWELLGFSRIEPPRGIDSSSVWLEAGEGQVHLLPTDSPQLPGSGHIALVDPDLSRTAGALGDAGHPVEQAAAHWGAERVKVSSPAGHLVELMAAPPA
jgi:catechol 2,3-dioxygenase-like lactoylglutathione lyase family enzyme